MLSTSVLALTLSLVLVPTLSVANTIIQNPSANGNYPYITREPKAGTAKPWKTILALHGSGSCGPESDWSESWWDASAMVANKYDSGGRTPAEVAAGEDYFLIAPHHETCDSAVREWEPKQLLSILSEAQSKYDLDTDSIHCSGYSMGGKGCWMVAITSPSTFCALEIAAGYDQYSSQYGSWSSAQLQTLVENNVGILGYYGTADTKQPYADAEPVFQKLAALGDTEAQLISVPGADHSAMSSTPWLYDSTWTWMAQQGKKGSSSAATSSKSTTTTSSTTVESSTSVPSSTTTKKSHHKTTTTAHIVEEAQPLALSATSTTTSTSVTTKKPHRSPSIRGHKTTSAKKSTKTPKTCHSSSKRHRRHHLHQEEERRQLESQAQAQRQRRSDLTSEEKARSWAMVGRGSRLLEPRETWGWEESS